MAFVMPLALRVVPSTGSTAMSTCGPRPSPPPRSPERARGPGCGRGPLNQDERPSHTSSSSVNARTTTVAGGLLARPSRKPRRDDRGVLGLAYAAARAYSNRWRPVLHLRVGTGLRDSRAPALPIPPGQRRGPAVFTGAHGGTGTLRRRGGLRSWPRQSWQLVKGPERGAVEAVGVGAQLLEPVSGGGLGGELLAQGHRGAGPGDHPHQPVRAPRPRHQHGVGVTGGRRALALVGVHQHLLGHVARQRVLAGLDADVQPLG